MSIREYKQGEHKSNFIGLRVVVLVGGDYRQKYYNFKKAGSDSEKAAMFEDAKALNTQWDKERILAAPPKKPKVIKKKKDIQQFKVPKKFKIVKAHENGRTSSGSLTKICKLLGLPYDRARKRLNEENGRSIVKGVLLEYVD